MSAHFDGGADIVGRRLREVEVMYVDDPTLDIGAEDSDDCPASPPPTYYLRVREEKKGQRPSTDGSEESSEKQDGTREAPETLEEVNCGNRSKGKKGKAWSWRYVNVEKKALLVWDRRGGQLLRSIPLADVESLLVVPDEHDPASILEVNLASSSARSVSSSGGGDGYANDGGGVLVLQARSRRETFLWAKVLQENVELMTKRVVPLENRDEDINLSDVQQLAKLLTHQLSELQDTGNQQPRSRNKLTCGMGVKGPIPEEESVDS